MQLVSLLAAGPAPLAAVKVCPSTSRRNLGGDLAAALWTVSSCDYAKKIERCNQPHNSRIPHPTQRLEIIGSFRSINQVHFPVAKEDDKRFPRDGLGKMARDSESTRAARNKHVHATTLHEARGPRNRQRYGAMTPRQHDGVPPAGSTRKGSRSKPSPSDEHPTPNPSGAQGCSIPPQRSMLIAEPDGP